MSVGNIFFLGVIASLFEVVDFIVVVEFCDVI